SARPALVVVNRLDAINGPTQGLGPINERVLAHGALAVATDLLGGGLADVDDGLAPQVIRLNLGISCHHATSSVSSEGIRAAFKTRRDRRSSNCRCRATG